MLLSDDRDQVAVDVLLLDGAVNWAGRSFSLIIGSILQRSGLGAVPQVTTPIRQKTLTFHMLSCIVSVGLGGGAALL
jgi:hypothetical protein